MGAEGEGEQTESASAARRGEPRCKTVRTKHVDVALAFKPRIVAIISEHELGGPARADSTSASFSPRSRPLNRAHSPDLARLTE